MYHEKQIAILKELMAQVDEGRNVDAGVQYRLPSRVYVDKEIAAKEWEILFRNHAQLIGLSGDLPESGSYFTNDDLGAPILATRDKDGRFRAFLNACRHRAVRLTKQPRGKTKLFTCPFHAWSYSTNGDLVAIPQEEHFGAIDKTCHSLIELPAEERAGLLFVHPQPDGQIDLDTQLGPLADELKSGKYDRLIHAGDKTIDMKLNWKLANDTFGETYHFQKLHQNTLGQIFHGDNLYYETIGRNHIFSFANRMIDQLRDVPEEDWRLRYGASYIYYIFPNIQLLVSQSFTSLIRIYPDPANPARSVTRISHYFTKSTLDRMIAEAGTDNILSREDAYDADRIANVGGSLEAVTEVFDSTISQEDYVMGEQQQVAAQSGLLKEIIFGRNEPALHHYHRQIHDAIGLPPLEPAPS